MRPFILIALSCSIWLSLVLSVSMANLPPHKTHYDMKGTKPSRPFGKASPIRLLKKTNEVPLPMPQANRPIRSEYISLDDHLPPVYLLISTSSKIYCMKMPNDYRSIVHSTYTTNSQQNLNAPNHPGQNYTVIYEETNFATNWITDVFYVKSEGLIYVNVYNSSSSSSEIFTLKYDSSKDTWTKKVLYKDQTYCLGITYNEEKRELYWTASKSIVSGSSFNSNGRHKVLFNLEAAKKLLYLKYDKQTDSIYVSTLNYVYQCSLKAGSRSDCRIIARDLLSARGLYLDSINRHLYVVDHKRKKIQRIKLRNNNNDYNYYDEEENSLTSSTLISSETTPDMGDIFYMCIFNRTYSNLLIWSEFSGKIKIANLNETSNYKVLFATNEYTYSVALMDNSTALSHPVPTTTVPVPTTSQEREKPSDVYDTASSYEAVVDSSSEVRSKEVEELTTTQTPISFNDIKATLLTWPRSRGSDEVKETEPTPSASVDNQVTVRLNDDVKQYKVEENSVPEAKVETASEPKADEENKENFREERVDYTIDRNQNNKIETSSPTSELMQSLSSILETTSSTTTTTTTTTTTEETTTTTETTPVAETELPSTDVPKPVETMSQREVDERAHYETKTSRHSHQTKEISPQAAQQHVVNLKKIKTQKSLADIGELNNKADESLKSETATSSSLASVASSVATKPSQASSFNFLRSSASHLNVALYIVISLLCFSLIINIILLYVSKLRERQGGCTGSGSGKLILTHEIRDKSETMPSQRSINTTKTTNSTGELGADCNINLLNSNGSASGIDSDH